MKKAIFFDRDGTLIDEPFEDCPIDSFERFAFIPKVFRNLYLLRQNADYEFIIVTNQDGLGTEHLPEEKFYLYHDKMISTFEGEGIKFDAEHIDPSFPEEKSPGRKPGTGMLTDYMNGNYDLANSFVIGDRLTDVELGKNLGAKSIWFAPKEKENEVPDNLKDVCVFTSNDWDEIYRFIMLPERTFSVKRNTNETKIEVELNLDRSILPNISTGLGFFDHMLEQLAKHSGCSMTVKVEGDLHVDEHHTIEDTALAIGQAYRKAIGNKLGIERYGYCLPMDDSQAQVSIDFSGRPCLVWNADFKREKIGDMPTEMFYHFFKSFSDAAACNLNIDAKGNNEHHKIEAVFKAVAKSIKSAIKRDVNNMQLPTTKGLL